MRTFKVKRPSQEHIQKMLIKARETSKRQLEILEMNGDILSKIELSLNPKMKFSNSLKTIIKERYTTKLN